MIYIQDISTLTNILLLIIVLDMLLENVA